MVRTKVIEYLAANGENYSFYVGDESEWAAYLAKMSRLRTWGVRLNAPVSVIHYARIDLNLTG